MEERPRAPSVVPLSREPLAHRRGGFSHGDPTPCGIGQDRIVDPHVWRHGTRLAHRFARARLHAPLRGLLPTSFPH